MQSTSGKEIVFGILIFLFTPVLAIELYNYFAPTEAELKPHATPNIQEDRVAAEAASIQVRGKNIKIGDTADYVFSILEKKEMGKQDVEPDPKNPKSLMLTKFYKADGQSFILSFARQKDPGPYVVTKILVNAQGSSPSENIIVAEQDSTLSILEIDRSHFFQKYKLVSRDVWPLKSGGMNHSYSFADPENPYSGFSIELYSDPTNIKNISIMWEGTSIRNPAVFTKPKEDFVRDLLESTFSEINPDALNAYVHEQKGKNYPGGGNVIPRKTLNGFNVYSGTVGSTLIIGIKK